ncbi:MAG: hypothetical protein IPK19_23510 [Chloroflexi bacterium]|nr:hypothetical protein [Chloroflexota bacterium]
MGVPRRLPRGQPRVVHLRRNHRGAQCHAQLRGQTRRHARLPGRPGAAPGLRLEDAGAGAPAQRFASHRDYFHADFVLPTFLDNHDMDRFLYIAGGDVEALKAAAQAQFALPGPPILYYGTEVGLSQAEGVSSAIGLDASRMPMIWDDDQNRDARLLPSAHSGAQIASGLILLPWSPGSSTAP